MAFPSNTSCGHIRKCTRDQSYGYTEGINLELAVSQRGNGSAKDRLCKVPGHERIVRWDRICDARDTSNGCSTCICGLIMQCTFLEPTDDCHSDKGFTESLFLFLKTNFATW